MRGTQTEDVNDEKRLMWCGEHDALKPLCLSLMYICADCFVYFCKYCMYPVVFSY